MFRYISLLWNPSDTNLGLTATQLSQRLTPVTGWEPALDAPGIRVFATGSRLGTNQSYTLAGDRGIVLGKLFCRNQLGQVSTIDAALDEDTSHRILQSEGQALVDGFWGRYIAFLPAHGGTRVLRDPSGTLPCHLTQFRGVWIVFSWLEDVFASMPQVPIPAVSWPGVVAHLLLGEIGGRATALLGVSQLLPGQAADLREDTDTRQLLWNAVSIARSPTHASTAHSTDMLRHVVRGCVRSWASCYESLVLRLSGGVDSSIVLSCLPEDFPRVLCLNYYVPGSDADERSYARLAAAKAERKLVELECDFSYRLERVLDVARTPTPSGYMGRMSMARMDAVVARENRAEALFTGGGGDQLFFEFRQWWPLADHLRLHGFDTGFVSAAMAAARLGNVSVWRAIRLALAERLRPTAVRQDIGRQLSLLRQDALPAAALHESYVHPALFGSIGLPIGKLTQTQQLMHPAGYYDPYELEAAPELVNPLLSQPLVELALRLPTYVLTHGGRGRALARRAFAESLPPEIATRRSKGGMNAFIKGILANNLDFARSMLLDGELMRHGFLERDRVETVLSNRPSAVTSHVSEIHVLIGVEAWLKLWTPPRADQRQR